eukprot:CAMPEP_0172501892 /NCGR_PEP_ID=MMETSP1066-20121228/154856_1 /TAXON_ID=671091 /ORGANISM="Coscinodiscus wailesii, Strain CCMP2513" /LENGTH=282 /DNA_ID=CAMNT_0013276937 /DNA_START=94 /DNA_END=942 /DNA_ORIENTATION=+
MRWAVGGWTFFIIENLILSENRTLIISRIGDDNYYYVYGTCSTAATASIAYAYFRKINIGSLPLRWPIGHPVPRVMLGMGFVLQSVGLVMASQVLPRFQIPVTAASDASSPVNDNPATVRQEEPSSSKVMWKIRCPFDFSDSKSYADGNDTSLLSSPRGLDRVTRHPGLWSIAFLGLGNAVMTPSVPRAVWMGMPVFVALIGGGHTDSRHKRGMGGTLAMDFEEKTSNMPFWAMIAGRQGSDAFQKLIMEEGKGLNAALAIGVVGTLALRKGRIGNVVKAVA